MNRIADLRTSIASLDDARKAFDEMAMLTIKVAALDAAAEKRIGKIKVAHELMTFDDRADIKAIGESLARFVEANKPLFKDPRKLKTTMGSFGLQAVSELVIQDEETLLKHLMKRELTDCYETFNKLLKKAIKKRLEAGEKLPAVTLNEGDTAVYKVEKSLIDAAEKEAACSPAL